MSTRISASVILTASLFCFNALAASVSANPQVPSVNAAVLQPEAALAAGQASPEAAQAKPAAATAPAKAAEPAAAAAAARQSSSRPSLDQVSNVRFDATITYSVRGGATITRVATLTVSDGSQGTLRAGNQVAVPSTTFTPTVSKSDSTATGQMAPMVSYNYKSVGINLDARNVRVDGNRVSAYLSVEFSAIDERSAVPARPPSFPTFQQTFTLVFESGKPIVVARSNDVVDNVESTQMVEVKATIVK